MAVAAFIRVDDPSLLAPLEVGSYLDGYRMDLMTKLSQDVGSGGMFRGGTGSWLLALFFGSCLEGQFFSFK